MNEKKRSWFKRLIGGEEKSPQQPPSTPVDTEQTVDTAPEEAPLPDPAPQVVVEPTPEPPPEQAVVVAAPAVAPKKGFFTKVKERLTKTKSTLVSHTLALFTRRGKIDEELLEEMEEALISADVGVETATDLIDSIRTLARKESKTDGDDFDWLKKTFHDLIIKEIGDTATPLNIVPDRLNIILVVGVNGTGKTTTVGKLANLLKTQGYRVLIAAADTFRAAAIDQVKIWADRAGVEIITGPEGGDPGAVVYNAVSKAQSRDFNVILVDTAGRLHTKTNLMKELEKISRIAGREIPDAPHETLLVLDASTGQNGLSQAKLFQEMVPLTGIVLTKLDGTAKGGVTLSVRNKLGISVKFVGLGEGMDDLEVFQPKSFVDALFVEGDNKTETVPTNGV